MAVSLGNNCVELRDAAAVVLAVTIDPLVPLDEPSEPAPEPAPEPEPKPSTEPTSGPEPAPKPVVAPRRADPIDVLLRFAGGIQYRALPTLAGGPSLAVSVRWRALRAELVGAWWLTRATHFEQVPEVGATLSLGWVAPRVCGVPSTSRVAFPLCAGLELGGTRAAASGIPAARTRTLPWVAAQIGGAVSVAVPGPVALWIGVDGVIPLVRPTFTVANLGALHRVPALHFSRCSAWRSASMQVDRRIRARLGKEAVHERNGEASSAAGP